MNVWYALLLQLTLFLGLSACGGSTKRLADLRNPKVTIFSFLAIPGSVWNFERDVNLILEAESGDECVQLSPNVSVTIDGIEFEQRNLGHGNYDPRNSKSENVCSVPQFVKTDFSQLPGAEASTTFKIADSSATFIIEVPNYLAERKLFIDTEGPLRVGQRVSLTWNTAVDASLASKVVIFAQPARDPTIVSAAFAGNSASFLVPREPIGPAVLNLDQRPPLTPSRCEGPTRCEVQAFLPDWLPVTISP